MPARLLEEGEERGLRGENCESGWREATKKVCLFFCDCLFGAEVPDMAWGDSGQNGGIRTEDAGEGGDFAGMVCAAFEDAVFGY